MIRSSQNRPIVVFPHPDFPKITSPLVFSSFISLLRSSNLSLLYHLAHFMIHSSIAAISNVPHDPRSRNRQHILPFRDSFDVFSSDKLVVGFVVEGSIPKAIRRGSLASFNNFATSRNPSMPFTATWLFSLNSNPPSCMSFVSMDEKSQRIDPRANGSDIHLAAFIDTY
ncbi:hypothetical protein BC829DRAFT_293947 [Chytridium lagenaria]|nr:hypothetical protein BC829DRAFT_293947 [Chytridium lagenaria]